MVHSPAIKLCSLVIKRAEQPQAPVLRVIATRVSMGDLELLMLCVLSVAASFYRFTGVCVCACAVCYGVLNKDRSLPVLYTIKKHFLKRLCIF